MTAAAELVTNEALCSLTFKNRSFIFNEYLFPQYEFSHVFFFFYRKLPLTDEYELLCFL